MKCVIIINEELPLGLIANTSAVLAMSLGKKFGEIVGSDVEDKEGNIHAGITQVSIPLLKGNNELIKSIQKKIKELENGDRLYAVDFCDVAQKSKQYDDYMNKMKQTSSEELSYLGLAMYGSANIINKLTGSIPLLR